MLEIWKGGKSHISTTETIELSNESERVHCASMESKAHAYAKLHWV